MESQRDRSKTKTAKGFQFAPFRPEGDGVPLSEAGLDDDEELVVFARAGVERGLVMRQMAYHHVAQGDLAGEPYLVTF
jgi:hypothetical protein